MPNRRKCYAADGKPNFELLKNELSSMRGIIEMDIDSKTGAVQIDYDDAFVSEKQMDRQLSEIGYRPIS